MEDKNSLYTRNKIIETFEKMNSSAIKIIFKTEPKILDSKSNKKLDVDFGINNLYERFNKLYENSSINEVNEKNNDESKAIIFNSLGLDKKEINNIEMETKNNYILTITNQKHTINEILSESLTDYTIDNQALKKEEEDLKMSKNLQDMMDSFKNELIITQKKMEINFQNLSLKMEDKIQLLNNDKLKMEDNIQLLNNDKLLMQDNIQLLEDNIQLLNNDKLLMQDNIQLLKNDNLIMQDNIQLLEDNKVENDKKIESLETDIIQLKFISSPLSIRYQIEKLANFLWNDIENIKPYSITGNKLKYITHLLLNYEKYHESLKYFRTSSLYDHKMSPLHNYLNKNYYYENKINYVNLECFISCIENNIHKLEERKKFYQNITVFHKCASTFLHFSDENNALLTKVYLNKKDIDLNKFFQIFKDIMIAIKQEEIKIESI